MSAQGYGVFINESRPITCWVGSRETCTHQMAIEGRLIDYYFMYGPAFTTILSTYTDLTGKATVPTKWSFGTWISRMSYYSQAEEVMEVARTLREMRFPSDVIHIDDGWFEQKWRCDWRFDKQRFPDPERMFREAGQMGFRLSLWQTPYVIEGTDAYREANEKRLLQQRTVLELPHDLGADSLRLEPPVQRAAQRGVGSRKKERRPVERVRGGLRPAQSTRGARSPD